MRRILFLLLAALSASCSRTVYLPAETVRTDSCYTVRWRVDSIIERDSTHVNTESRNDTVYLTKYVERTSWRDRVVRDTVFHHSTDTIRESYPVEVEKKLTPWQQTKLHYGGYAMLALFLVLLYLFKRK